MFVNEETRLVLPHTEKMVFTPAMEGVQALLVAQTADAIVGFLYRVHRQDLLRTQSALPKYDDNAEFNDWINEHNDPVRIIDLEYKPSEVLYNVDLQAYRDYLLAYEPEDEATAKKEGVVPK